MGVQALNLLFDRESKINILNMSTYELYLGVDEAPIFTEDGVFNKENTILKWKLPIPMSIKEIKDDSAYLISDPVNLRKLIRKEFDHFNDVVLKISYDDEVYYMKLKYVNTIRNDINFEFYLSLTI